MFWSRNVSLHTMVVFFTVLYWQVSKMQPLWPAKTIRIQTNGLNVLHTPAYWLRTSTLFSSVCSTLFYPCTFKSSIESLGLYPCIFPTVSHHSWLWWTKLTDNGQFIQKRFTKILKSLMFVVLYCKNCTYGNVLVFRVFFCHVLLIYFQVSSKGFLSYIITPMFIN